MKRVFCLNIFLLAFFVLVLFPGRSWTQVNGFTMYCPSSTVSAGNSFPVTFSFNWTNATTSATIKLDYDQTLVTYDASCASILPGCISISNDPVLGELVISIANLSSCPSSTASINFDACFRFKCDSGCAGTPISALFDASITDDLGTNQMTSCTTTGQIPLNWTLNHYFHSYNSLTNEVTFKVFHRNMTCFALQNPYFEIVPVAGTIVNAWGNNYNYVVSGTTITPSTSTFSQYNWDWLYYVVQLPCTLTNYLLTSDASLRGDNCGISGQLIKGPETASFNIPLAPVPIVSANLSTTNFTAPNRFKTTIQNNGNTPLDLTLTDDLPSSISTYQFQLVTNQPTLATTINTFDCSSAPSGTISQTGSGGINAISASEQIVYTITNLQPGNVIDFYVYFVTSSACVPGLPPYIDNLTLTYNCNASTSTCLSCGTGSGTETGTNIYNPKPKITCVSSTYIDSCNVVGDTLQFCMEFKNTGDGALSNGIYKALLPGWLQIDPTSITYSGFSPNPIYQTSTNATWTVPSIPVGTSTYEICFDAIIHSGATAGSHSFWTKMDADYVCYNQLKVCAFSALGIEKRVKGDLDASFGSSGNGTPGSVVDYEVEICNTGTKTLKHLEVIDRLPSTGDLTILGSPSSNPRGTQFDVTPTGTPVISNCTVSYSNTANICTGWTGVGVPCNSGTWSISGNRAMQFLFNQSVVLAPGDCITFNFQGLIPSTAQNGELACNTAGFSAKEAVSGTAVNPAETDLVCIEVFREDPPPPTCCEDLLKNIQHSHTIQSNEIDVSLNLAAGPSLLQKASVSLVSFEVDHPVDCDVCVKDPLFFGNIVPGTSPLTWNTVPPGMPFTHLIEWEDPSGVDWSGGIPLNFDIPLPAKSLIDCCCDTINYSLLYTFTDMDCMTCDTIINYTINNPEHCEKDPPPACRCKFGNILLKANSIVNPVICGGKVKWPQLRSGTDLSFLYDCKSVNGGPCRSTIPSVTLKDPGGTTHVLSGPNYSHNLSMKGIYTYTLSASCGGTQCKCVFYVDVQ